MSQTFLSSELKKNSCTQAGANVAPARPWVGHAAYIDFVIDIEQKLCIYISQIYFKCCPLYHDWMIVRCINA